MTCDKKDAWGKKLENTGIRQVQNKTYWENTPLCRPWQAEVALESAQSPSSWTEFPRGFAVLSTSSSLTSTIWQTHINRLHQETDTDNGIQFIIISHG